RRRGRPVLHPLVHPLVVRAALAVWSQPIRSNVPMKRRHSIPALAATPFVAALALLGCNSRSSSSSAGSGEITHLAGAPDWCGTKKITLAQLDGFGGNSWRLVTTASGEDEVKKCPSVTSYLYLNDTATTQKSISDIQA